MNEPLIDESNLSGELCPRCNERMNGQGVCENCELDVKSRLIEKVAIAFAFVSTFGFFVKIVFF